MPPDLRKPARRVALAVGVLLLGVVAVCWAEDRKPLGEGWKKVKGAELFGPEGQRITYWDMVKEITVEARCPNNTGSIQYTVPTENGHTVVVEESREVGHEGWLGVRVGDRLTVQTKANVENGKMKPCGTDVRFGKVSYHDLDGDGVLDAMYDGREESPKPMIMLDGTWTPVANYKSIFHYPKNQDPIEERSPDHSVNYVFAKGVWTAKSR